MKIMLIKPYGLTDHIQPPLGLGYLTSALRKDHRVELLDCMKEKFGLRQTTKAIRDFGPDVVGVQCYTFQLNIAKDILKVTKGINPSIVTVVGGPHPSSAPDKIFNFFEGLCDYGFKGEAEAGLPLLTQMIERKGIARPRDIPGLIWRDNGAAVVNPPYFTQDLDSLGTPAWDILKPEDYPQAQHGAFFKKFPIAPIMLTRGCPYSCTFCAAGLISGRKLRRRSIQNVIAEIEMLYYDRGIREFLIVDDNFTLDIDYAKGFLRSLKRTALDISWAVPNGIRIDAIDEEALGLMKSTGLYLVSLGIESGSNRILQLMRKGFRVDDVRRAVKMIRSFGIEIAGFFIVGFPGEKRQDIEATIRLSLELDLIRAHFSSYLPLPGTESAKALKGQEKSKIDYDNFFFMSAAYTPEGLTKAELRGLQRKAFLKFFLRPRIFFKNVTQIKSFRHFRFLLGRFKNWIIRPV